MVGLQKLLAFAFSVIGAGALATSAAFARESAGIIGLYKDIVATEGPGEAQHYSSLANSLVCLTKQKFEKVFSVVSLLVRYVNIAHVYSEFENELQDKKSSEYQKYKAAVEGHKKEFGKLHMGASRRQYILTQAGPWRVWRARGGPSSWAVRGQAVGQEPLYQDGEAAQHRPRALVPRRCIRSGYPCPPHRIRLGGAASHVGLIIYITFANFLDLVRSRHSTTICRRFSTSLWTVTPVWYAWQSAGRRKHYSDQVHKLKLSSSSFASATTSDYIDRHKA